MKRAHLRDESPQADLLIIGGGGAGLTCAFAAAQAGKRATIIEKASQIGGTYWISGGSFAASNSRLTVAAGIDDNPDKHIADAVRIGRGTNDGAVLSVLVNKAGPTLDWLLDMGLELVNSTPRIPREHEPYTIARTYDAKGGGKGFLDVLMPAIQREVSRGLVDIMLETNCTALLRGADGRVNGVRVQTTDGGERELRARAIVLAGGGYGANREMVRRFNPGFENAVSFCPDHSDGSLISIAEAAGVQLTRMESLRAYPLGLPQLDDSWKGKFGGFVVRGRLAVAHGGFWVNSSGKRFINEETPSPDPIEEAITQLPDKAIYVLFDAKGRRGLEACPIPAWDWSAFDRAASSQDNRQVVMGSTLGELASRGGLNAAALAETAKRWNSQVALGQDADFGRRTIAPLDTAPFYAIVTKGALLLTMGGVRVNGQCQVLDTQNRIIPGLYAAGEVIGDGQFMGDGLVSGLGNTACLVFGKMLGESLP